SVVVAPTAADQAPSAEETKPFETDESAATPPPHLAYRTTARISIPAPVPMPAWTDSEVLPSASRREDRPEVTLPPRKRLHIALVPRYEVGESSSAAAARPAGDVPRGQSWLCLNPPMHSLKLCSQSHDTDEIYMRLDDEQTERQLLAGRLNMLFRDRRAHAYTRQLIETEARMSREAWVRATDASDLVHGEKQMAPRRTTRSTTDQETINATSVTNAQLQAMIDQGVTAALAARDALRSTNGDDSHNSRTGVTAALAARDALRSTNGDDSHNSRTGVRRTERATRECTYTDFHKCQPLPFKGTEGVASLSQWCKRMDSVFHISNCAAENQVKFATRMFSEESDKIEKYDRGLPDMIHGSVVASKPKTMQEATEIAT
nr:hypothetical protein [Tanacetum cinerariifolium]